ncbi:MAG: hypothetical protein JXJ20_07785 [Anaerolineae bacterium]|nr:hypothetical protein [Anaerolineae bacterium]
MSARPPGRRMESLFDNRYRYDYIYPRGRSGETLRAYDTQDNDRPVVIKRPAPQDAPPMRAGQEVSIRNEKKALERLSGHSVLTELRGSGSFRVGGHTHEYIVMDLAVGQIAEDMVLELAEQGEYLPELETLVIMDNLLDLLAYAHDHQVIYNDVDAKHLFWDRDNYRLKVIDWGNAVFTDEPGALPTVTRSADIYQCGELLFFILTGGNRLTTQVDEGGDTFFVNFGPDAERIPARLQTVLTRAVHPDPKRRYGDISELRHALGEYRQPLEKARDEIVSRVHKRVRSTASKEELEELADSLQDALNMDPGYPKATALAAEIQHFLRQISIQADLDAVRIYLESGNWPRAVSLLHDLLPTAEAENEPLIRFLIAATVTLEDLQIASVPDGFLDALDPLFKGDAPAAGQVLLAATGVGPKARQAQWLLAEQLATLVSDVVLLRPHLVRLRHDLQAVAGAERALAVLDDAETLLDSAPLPGLTGLQVVYQQAEAILARLEPELDDLAGSREPVEHDAALASLGRARHAANEVARQLEEVGNYIYGEPSHAGDLLYRASMIDPTSPYFDALHDYFDEVHQAITALGQFKPKSDGTNLAAWFAGVQDFLQPYLEDLPDRQLHAAAAAIRRAAEGWTTVVNYLALGRRQPTIEMLRTTADTLRPYNEVAAAWMGTLANRLPDTTYTERLSPNTRLADLLIDGWKAWDGGQGTVAAEMGRRAHKQATTDGERLAADRLCKLGELLENWLADDGPRDAERTDQAETEVLAIFLTEEEQERRTFADQMPNTGLYLRAMSRGIVSYMHQSSSGGWRALYMHYVLRGMLSLLDDNLDDAEFWRNAAANTFEEARTHRAFQVLDRALTGRRLVQAAEKALNGVSGPNDLAAVREALNAPLAGEMLTGAEQSVQLLSDALRSWSDGDFHSVRQALDESLDQIDRAIQVADLHIDSFVEWLTDLRDAAAELQQARLVIEQKALSTSEEPDPAIAEAHHQIVTLTLDTLGPDYAHQVRQWEEMYGAVLETYTTQRLDRREKLAAFDRHFASLFISKHPSYPLFRHWESVIENLPEEAPEDDVIALESIGPTGEDASLAYLEDDREPEPDAQLIRAGRREGELPWNLIIIGALIVLAVAIAFGVMRYTGREDKPLDEDGAVPTGVIGPAVQPDETEAAAALPSPTATRAPTDTPIPSSPTPTLTATLESPTITPTEAPTETQAVEATPTVFVTSTIAPSATPAPVAASNKPNRDVLVALAELPGELRPWPDGAFEPGDGNSWMLSTAGSEDGTLAIELSPELMSELFQPGVANTLIEARAVLELVAYDPASMANGEVGFGLGAENSFGQRTIGQVQYVEESLVDLGMNQNGQFRSRTQAPLGSAQIELTVRRVDDTTFGFLVDGRSLGDSVALFAEGDPVTLIVFVSGTDVVVEISTFLIDFRPRDELP